MKTVLSMLVVVILFGCRPYDKRVDVSVDCVYWWRQREAFAECSKKDFNCALRVRDADNFLRGCE